ncbi:MAG TPA: DUF2793 domain-containing protein [Afipia sp.]
MTDTANLALPFIDGSQAQKHVTHNEALRILDAAIQIGVADMNLTTPPPTPANGERHVVASGATGAWAGQANAIATWEDGAWRFLVPRPGWLVWSAADSSVFVFDGASWSAVSGGGGGSSALDNTPHVGINSTATSPNLLSVQSNAALFNSINAADGGTGDARIQISKENSTNTASVVFSDAFSGRAEFGLVGSDDFKLKVSHDGTAFVEAFTIDQTSGNLALPRGVALSGVSSPAQITANQNDYNPAGIASASILQLSSDASRTISGLASGAEGRIVCVLNVGSQAITLADESVSSSAANRFALGTNLVIASKQAAILRYDGTAARWFAIARSSSGGGLSISTSADLAGAISDETGSGALVFASSPVLAGTPLAPTAVVDTNTTQLATTAFVLAQASASGDGTPAANGTASRGTSTHYARADHVHPTDTSRAPASNIALSALATQANNTFVGNVAGSAAPPAALTAGQVTAALSTMVGDTGGGGAKGLVPAPGAGDGSAGKFLKADGTYAVPPGTGGGGGGGLSDADRQNILLARIYQSKLYGGYRRFINAFADGYKASSGINAGASSAYVLNGTNGFVSPTSSYLATTSVADQLASMTVNASGWSGYTMRQVFSGAVVLAGGNFVRVSLSSGTDGAVVQSAFIGAASGTAGSFAAIPMQLTVGGSTSFSIPPNTTVQSDWLPFVTTPGSPIVCSVYFNGSTAVKGNTTVGSNYTMVFKSGVNEAGLVSISGYTSNPGYLELFNKIEVSSSTIVDNMTLVTTAQTADATVSNGRVLIEYDNTASPALNTDLIVEVTCNGGANWTSASLSSVSSNGQAGRKIVETVDQACTSGTSFAARVKTLNNKNVPIYGLGLTVH